jgi:hypothetical protein
MLNVVFTTLHKKNGFPKVIKYGNLLSNKGSKSMFIKLLVYFYTKIQLLINCILMGLIMFLCLMFKLTTCVIFIKFQSDN